VRPDRRRWSTAPALHLLTWSSACGTASEWSACKPRCACYIYAGTCNFMQALAWSLAADEATWIQERLGDITSVRIYQVETDSERRHACQSAQLATAPTSVTHCGPPLTRDLAASLMPCCRRRASCSSLCSAFGLTHSCLLCRCDGGGQHGDHRCVVLLAAHGQRQRQGGLRVPQVHHRRV
jgi:hypothetical protein